MWIVLGWVLGVCGSTRVRGYTRTWPVLAGWVRVYPYQKAIFHNYVTHIHQFISINSTAHLRLFMQSVY